MIFTIHYMTGRNQVKHYKKYPRTTKSSRSKVLEIKDVLKNFGKFSGENLSESLFSIELQAYTLQLYLKRYSGTGVSP